MAIFTMIALGSWGWLIQNLALAALALFAFVRNTGRPLRKVPSILFLLVIIPSAAACLVSRQTLADPDSLFCVPVNLVGVGGSLILGFLFACLCRQPLKTFGQLDEADETPS
ncbi:hypothetical protein [Roseibium sp. Sym1]|uniref:hypothetical protein n=1 Tax=Roseibium sp. Sym1 TaxID=3016006 RepID=UPI0022B374B4|nr:hypothetical protein [Roseibium sp. Sym1]